MTNLYILVGVVIALVIIFGVLKLKFEGGEEEKAKYRYNKLGLGDIDGIPRVLAGCPTITRKSNDNNVILLYVADNSNSYR